MIECLSLYPRSQRFSEVSEMGKHVSCGLIAVIFSLNLIALFTRSFSAFFLFEAK